MSEFLIKIADKSHFKYAEAICEEMGESAKARGTGIAKRTPDYIQLKMSEGKAVIAIHNNSEEVAGFCYVESWGHDKFVANSGLIVFPRFRKNGLARLIKEKAFELSRSLFPNAKLFGLTTSMAVMKINSKLGYIPVPFSELTDDDAFWNGCKSCVNYHILVEKERKNCLCTGMLYEETEEESKPWKVRQKEAIIKRLKSIKEAVFLGNKEA